MPRSDTIHAGDSPSEGNFTQEYPSISRFIAQFDPYKNDALKNKAKYFYDDIVKIRALFGALDGLIISYSTFKYVFDLITPPNHSASTALHDWMNTAPGASIVTLETICIIALSMVGNVFSDNDKNPLIRGMAWFWPYFRDAFKGLKFAYKGIRSTFQVATAMGFNFQKMLLPVGLFLGVVAGVNRLWYRSQVTDKRKNYQKTNNDLLRQAQNLGVKRDYDIKLMTEKHDDFEKGVIYLKINEKSDIVVYKVYDPAGELVEGEFSLLNDLGYNAADKSNVELTAEYLKTHHLQAILTATHSKGHTAMHNNEKNRQAIRDAMGAQPLPPRPLVMMSALLGGFADGLYTYMGAMGIAVLSPPLFFAMTICSVLFTVLCILNRYHEENEYQNDFERSRLNVEWVLVTQEVTEIFRDLHKLSKTRARLNLKEDDPLAKQYDEETKKLDDAFASKNATLEKIKARYHELAIYSTQRAILAGLRSGLYFYSAISSVIFVCAAGYALTATAFPPALLAFAALAGVLALVGFVVHSVLNNTEHVNKYNSNKNSKLPPERKLSVVYEQLKTALREAQAKLPTVSQERDALIDSLHVDPSPQFHFQEAFEVLRSFCSGLSKGTKAGDFSCNALLEKDDHGQLQEPAAVVGVGLFASAAYGIVYGLRAFGKNFRAANDVPLPSLPEASNLFEPMFNDSPFSSRASSIEDVPSQDSTPIAEDDSSIDVLSRQSSQELRERPVPRPLELLANSQPNSSYDLLASPYRFFSREEPQFYATYLAVNAGGAPPPQTPDLESAGVSL